MYIEFNIALNGKHFFATAERSCTNSGEAETVKKVLQEKFPESEGYEISASANPQRSYGIDLNKPMNDEMNRILKQS